MIMRIKILLLIIITILSAYFMKAYAQGAYSKSFSPYKTAFVSDIHLSFNQRDSWILYKESLVILQDVIKLLNKDKTIDYVVFNGDITENKDGQLSDLPMFLDVVSDLNRPYSVITGDRDVDLAEYIDKKDFMLEFTGNSSSFWSKELNEDILLIALDTAIKNNFEGTLSDEQLSWLDNELRNNKNKFIIIAMHHNAFPVSGIVEESLWKDYSINNWQKFNDILNKYQQNKLVISSHRHTPFYKVINKTIYLSLPSITSYPCKYTEISILPDKITIENKQISYKQIVKLAKRQFIKSDMLRKYSIIGKDELLKIQKGFSKVEIPLK